MTRENSVVTISAMVLYEDKKWLCRLIRNAFTMDDDTGICEKMFKDRPYIGPDEVDSDPISSDESFDIREGSELGHRRRSYTAVRLEKLEKQRKTRSATQNIKVNTTVAGTSDLSFERDTSYRDKVETDKSAAGAFSVKKLIESVPHPDEVPFSKYIRFDATSQQPVPSKNMAIFLSFLEPKKRAYPLRVCVTMNGKIQDLVGLILWLTSQKYPEIELHPVHHYNLQIADEDGDWDADFPPLESLEAISKFSFSHLALVKCNKVQLANPSLGKLNLSFLLPDKKTFKLDQEDVDITIGELVTLVLNKSGWSKNIIPFGCADIGYHLEKLGDPSVRFLDSSLLLMQCKCRDFCLVRDGSKSVQSASATVEQEWPSRNPAGLEVGRSDLYRVMVSTGRFNKLKNALCVIWSGDRLDVEFQHTGKTKTYPLNSIGGVKFDATKNKVLLTLNQNHSTSAANHYLTTTNQLTFITEELRIATQLYQHLNLILTSK